jgi:hypothetical protein
MRAEPKVYFRGIEKKLIEMINKSNNSIKIAMAWFTNEDIKDSLIQRKESTPNIDIKIVVDDNEINKRYFLNYESKFEDIGIQIKKKASDRFLHNKFMIIDEAITITGSYNYSKKANTNLENIIVINSSNISSYYSRIFEFLTNKNYVDENIKLLFENPKFAQELFSTYYPFSKTEYLKYKDKIEIGDCFTHENGMYDEIKYFPGLIFNPKICHSDYRKSDFFEFNIPVDKQMIKSWVEGRDQNLILDSFRGYEEHYHLINDELEKNEQAVENYFKRKMEKTYRHSKLKKLIKDGVDIILEDDLWLNNFEPFLNKRLIEKIFAKIEIIEENTRGNYGQL